MAPTTSSTAAPSPSTGASPRTIETASTLHLAGRLDGRVAVVTGGGTGIGAATADSLSALGAGVAVLGRRPEPIADVAERTGGVALQVDATDLDALTSALDQVRGQIGRPDLVVANAGLMLAAPFDQAGRSEWQRMIDVNLLALLDTARAATPDLLAAAEDGGAADLVLVSSIGAHMILPTYAVYTATKAAVTQLGRQLRAELGPRGVRVHVIEPGMTRSELGEHMENEEATSHLRAFAVDNPPIEASAVGDSIAWMCAQPADVNIGEMVVLPTVQG